MASEGLLKHYLTPSNQRRFCKKSLSDYVNINSYNLQETENIKTNFLYARVSSKKQSDDLNRQIEYIKSSKLEYSNYMLITDIASGINFKRKGLSTILDACLQGTIGEVVIAHRDRLSRFGFELIQQLILKAGGTLTVLDNPDSSSPEKELSDDILSIIHIFSCRQMGKRKYKQVTYKDNSNTIEIK